MADKQKTLWNNETERWSSLPMADLENVAELHDELKEFASRVSDEPVKERMKPYDAPVTEEVLRQIVR